MVFFVDFQRRKNLGIAFPQTEHLTISIFTATGDHSRGTQALFAGGVYFLDKVPDFLVGNLAVFDAFSNHIIFLHFGFLHLSFLFRFYGLIFKPSEHFINCFWTFFPVGR